MRYLIIIFLFVGNVCTAQVINIETLRKPTDSTKWTGSVSLDVSLIKNTNDIFRLTNKAHVQYDDTVDFWLFVSDFNLQKIENNALVNRGTQHLRYNRKISKKIKWEIFAQGQYDAISAIGFRGLIGTGPRFKLFENEKYRFYLGTLVMFEYEKAANPQPNRIQNDFRGSVYVSFSLYPTETISIISTSYYQPQIDVIKDYRFSSSTSFLFKILDNLAFKANFNFFHDAFPVTTEIPKTQFELTNGLLYTF